ncbi:MAG: HAMP domain-containing protein [SAR324 cluster bacterium]|nr:HAMP domain-containing protein [SAR324 cluster bacterium]
MNIKQKFQLNIALSIGLISGIGLIVFWSSQLLEETFLKKYSIDQIIHGIFDLNLLTEDYLLHQETRPVRQWHSTHDDLSRHLMFQSSSSNAEQFLYKEIQLSHTKLDTIFSSLVAEFQSQNFRNKSAAQFSPKQERLISQLQTVSMSMVSNAKQLSALNKNEVGSTLRKANAAAIVFVVIVAFAFMLNSILLNQKIIKPITALHQGIQSIIAQHLNLPVEVKPGDELEQLTDTFEQMKEKLDEAQGMLHQEIEKQKRSNVLIEELNENLSKQVNALAASNKELDDFAYIAAHDLKEPLRAIRFYAQSLTNENSRQLSENANEKLDRMLPLTQQMEDLIDALLFYSRVGRTEQAYQEVNLQSTLNNVLKRFLHSIEESCIEIRVPHPLPTLFCDSIRVGEVFYNLISNAVKYSDKLNKWIEIGWQEGNSDATGKGKKKSYIFYVKDNGIGIQEKHFDAIFQMFRRLHGKDKFGGGVGAGLTFVKKIIAQHEGRIWLESTYKEGSTFYFTLQKGA